MKVGILGASGYTGAELLRLLATHPSLEVAVVTAHSHAGQPVAGHTPSLAAAYPGLVYEENDPGRLDGLDVVFCALPHGESQRVVPELRRRVGLVVDLAADFRLRDASQYPRWYGGAHAAPELLVDPDVPAEAWQLETLVLPAHRGSRLGLAVKLANLDALAGAAPAVRRITTGNAAVNDPMIAVNDMKGFSVAGAGHFWQRELGG